MPEKKKYYIEVVDNGWSVKNAGNHATVARSNRYAKTVDSKKAAADLAKELGLEVKDKTSKAKKEE